MKLGNLTIMLPMTLIVLFTLAACGDYQKGSGSDGVRGVSDKEIILGSHQDLSGPLVAWSEGISSGLTLAVEEANQKGGINGRKLKLVIEDSGYDPRKAVLATRKLIDRDKIFAMVSPLGSTTSLASMPLVLRKGILHVFPFSAARSMFEPYHPLKFSIFTPYFDTVGAGIDYVVKKYKVKRAGIIYQDDDFGTEVYKGAVAQLKAMGLKPVSVTSYKRGATDFSTQVARMRADGADFLVMGTIIRETIGVAKTAQALGWKVPMVCTQACYTPETAALGGKAVHGLYATGNIEVPYANVASKGVRDWFKRYKKRFKNRTPNLQALGGYIAMQFLIDALRQAGRDLTQEKVAKILETMPPWKADQIQRLPYDFTATDHLGAYKVFMAKIGKDNRWKTIPNTDMDVREVKKK